MSLMSTPFPSTLQMLSIKTYNAMVVHIYQIQLNILPKPTAQLMSLTTTKILLMRNGEVWVIKLKYYKKKMKNSEWRYSHFNADYSFTDGIRKTVHHLNCTAFSISNVLIFLILILFVDYFNFYPFKLFTCNKKIINFTSVA
jgi:hypothetical protein